MNKHWIVLPLYVSVVLVGTMNSAYAETAGSCSNRGLLDTAYCDENRDLIADAPKDKKMMIDPPEIVFTYNPHEDPFYYGKIFEPFTGHMSQCVGKKFSYYHVQTKAAEIEAFQNGQLHLASFSTGATNIAVNMAGAVPFATRGGSDGEQQGYHVIVIVKANGPYQTLKELKGKQVAHSSPSSNSGHMAPRALFPALGLTPGEDYELLFSGSHVQSIDGVWKGTYDAAAIASDTLAQAIAKNPEMKASDFRVIYKSGKFPATSLAYAYNLAPKLAKKIESCTFSFTFSPEMKKIFKGADRYVPANFAKDWESVRAVVAANGQMPD